MWELSLSKEQGFGPIYCPVFQYLGMYQAYCIFNAELNLFNKRLNFL